MDSQAFHLKIQMFGRLEVQRDGEVLPDAAWVRHQTQTLLKLLLTHRGQVVTRDQLLEALYPRLDPVKAADSLRGRISELRRALEPGLTAGRDSRYIFKVGRGGYCFNTEAPCWIDLDAFEAHLERGRRLKEASRWAHAAEAFEGALTLYRDDLLTDDLYEEWTLAPRARYRELFLTALEEVAACHAEAGQPERAIACCQRAVERNPQREAAYRLQMHCHLRMGERQAALRTYQRCAQMLKAQGLPPSEALQALRDRLYRGASPSADDGPHNLPRRLTPFFGREPELDQLAQQLDAPDCRLLTLVGPGGIGKTRLALEAARRQTQRFPDGVWWVSLSSVESPDFLVYTIADAFDLTFQSPEPPQTMLFNFLRDKELLLILDNFEQLQAASGLLAELLAAAPHLKLLVTSRARLRLAPEWVFEVGGLPVPTEEGAEASASSSAMRLFVQSARRVHHDFALTEANAPDVLRLCRLVDGMPLAIELAASWARALSCREVAAEVERGIGILWGQTDDVPERHRSVEAVFESTWQMLTEGEREALMRLSVFRGGFTREAAQHVAGADLSTLTALMDKSLVRKRDDRYGIHNLLRWFAQDKLQHMPDCYKLTCDRYCDYYGDFLAQKEWILQGETPKPALNKIEAELENIRASWYLSLRQEKKQFFNKSLNLLGYFYEITSRFQEAKAILEESVTYLNAREISDGKSEPFLGQLLAQMAKFELRLGFYERAKTTTKRCLEIARALDDSLLEARTLYRLGIIRRLQGDYQSANELQRETLDIHEKIGDELGLCQCLNELGVIAIHSKDYCQARALHQKCLELAQRNKYKRIIAISLNNLAEVERLAGKFERAKLLYRESLNLEKELDNQWGLAISTKNLSLVAESLGDYEFAKRQCHECLYIVSELGDKWAISRSLHQLGSIYWKLGEFEQAERYLNESLALTRETGDRWTLAMNLMSLGRMHVRLNHLDDADEFHQESLTICRTIEEPRGIAQSLIGCALVALAGHEPEDARASLREALSTAMDMGALPVVLDGLYAAAEWFVQQGEFARAAELFQMIRQHAAAEHLNKADAERRLHELAPRLEAIELPPIRRPKRDLSALVERTLSALQ